MGGSDGERFYTALIAENLYRKSKQSETAWEVPVVKELCWFFFFQTKGKRRKKENGWEFI